MIYWYGNEYLDILTLLKISIRDMITILWIVSTNIELWFKLSIR